MGLDYNALIARIASPTSLRAAVRELDLHKQPLNARSYEFLLRKCKEFRAPTEVRQVHIHINTFPSNYSTTFLSNLVISVHSACRCIGQARSVFEKMYKRNCFSWNIMLSAYAHNGDLTKAQEAFDKMPSTDSVSWASMLTMISNTGSVQQTKNLFDTVPERGSALWNIMLAAYSKSGYLFHVQGLFDKMPFRDVNAWNIMLKMISEGGKMDSVNEFLDRFPGKDIVSWNTYLAAIARHGQMQGQPPVEWFFYRMPQHDVISCNTVIGVHAQTGHLVSAREIFDSMVQRDTFVWLTMLVGYVDNKTLNEAIHLFREMPERDTTSWSVIIAGYAQKGHTKSTLQLLSMMDLEGLEPDNTAYTRIFDACTGSCNLSVGKLVHETMSSLEYDTSVGTALVNMYGKFGYVEEAELAFKSIARPDVIAWTAMVNAYAQNGHINKAKCVFEESPERNLVSWNAMLTAYARVGHPCSDVLRVMDIEGVLPDKSTYIAILDASISDMPITTLRIIHTLIAESGFDTDAVVGTGLINSYGRCGNLTQARDVFERIVVKDLIAWAALVGSYSRNGLGKDALDLFRLLQLQGEVPNEVVYMSVLSACSHVGLLEDARDYFLSLTADYGIAPSIDHYVCMADLLGRAGKVGESDELLNSMPYEPHEVAWTSLVSACGNHGDEKRGRKAFHQLENPD